MAMVMQYDGALGSCFVRLIFVSKSFDRFGITKFVQFLNLPLFGIIRIEATEEFLISVFFLKYVLAFSKLTFAIRKSQSK